MGRPSVWRAIRRGVKRRCPHCGEGRLFRAWFTMYDRCAQCQLVFLRNSGDTWLFWIIGDRIPIAVGIAVIYFGFRVTGWASGLAFFLALVVPLVWTMPHRQGVAVALNYLSRVYLPDPSDELPSGAGRRDPGAAGGEPHG